MIREWLFGTSKTTPFSRKVQVGDVVLLKDQLVKVVSIGVEKILHSHYGKPVANVEYLHWSRLGFSYFHDEDIGVTVQLESKQ